MKLRLGALSLALILVGCGDAANEPTTGGLTREENESLNRAAEKLDQREAPPRLTDGELPATPQPPTGG